MCLAFLSCSIPRSRCVYSITSQHQTSHQLVMLLEATVTLVVTKWKNTVQHRLSRRFDIPDKFISAQNSRVCHVFSM